MMNQGTIAFNPLAGRRPPVAEPAFRVGYLRFAGKLAKVMSYNTDGLNSPDGPKAEGIARRILEYDPDVVAMQEVRSRELVADFVARRLRNRYPNQVVFHTEDRGRMAIISKTDFPLEDASFYENSPDGRALGRGLLEVTVKPAGVQPLHLYNMHLRANNGKGRDEERLLVAQTGRDLFTRRVVEDPGALLMLVGDGNVIRNQHGSQVLNTLSGADHPNPAARLVEIFEKTIGRIFTWKFGRHQSKLDYAFVSPSLEPYVKDQIVCGEVEPEVSHHRPLMVTVELPDLPKAAAGSQLLRLA